MRGFKPKEARAAAQNFADGGIVKSVKGFLGLDPERNARMAEYRAASAASKAAEAPAAAPAPAPQRAITEYASGSAMARREAAAGLKNGGPVRGPGTGTSDDVPDDVAPGTFIMPSDSTKAIGEQALAGMGGDKVPVNLSNGEFKLPPEQVHAVGVQALNQMKDASHTPVPEQGAGQGFKPEVFFANGGAVDDPTKPKPQGFVMPKAGQGPSDIFMQDRADEMRSQASAGNYAGVAGTALRTAGQGLGMYALEAADRIVSPVLNVAGRVAGGLLGTDTPGGDVKPSAAPPVTPSAPAAATPTATAMTAPQVAVAAPGAAALQPQAASAGGVLPNNVTRVGNSYSGANIGQGFTVNGAELGAVRAEPTAQTAAAAQGLSDRYAAEATRTAAVAPGAGMTAIGGDPNRERAALIRSASTGYKGAQNGQLTANQLNIQRGMLTDEARDATTRYQSDQTTSSNRDIAAMRETGDMQRAGMRELGETVRAGDRNSLDARRVGLEERGQGFKLAEAQRMEKLRDSYQSAKPEERKAIAQQIRELQGSTVQQDAWAHSPGGQVIDPKTQQLITQPGVIYNRHTGETREAAAAPPTPPQNHIDALKKNPALAAEFDQQYGAGAAARATAPVAAQDTRSAAADLPGIRPAQVGAAGVGVAASPANLKSITAKQIPAMTDVELQQAIQHYGPEHKRTAKLQKEAARRAADAPTATTTNGVTDGTQANQAQQPRDTTLSVVERVAPASRKRTFTSSYTLAWSGYVCWSGTTAIWHMAGSPASSSRRPRTTACRSASASQSVTATPPQK